MESAVARRQTGARHSRLMEVDRISNRRTTGLSRWPSLAAGVERPTSAPPSCWNSDSGDLLEQVDVISGVSGGTLPAVYYGLGDKAGAFTEPAVREALGYDFQSSWIRRWFLPQNIFRYWLSDFTRSDIMVQVFNNQLYHDATFADLQPHPKILINSTVHNDHTRFTFTDERFAALHSVLAPYPVANAVNASSAFPGAFQDVTLQWYMEPTQYMHLYDGGPIDNLGVQAITQYMNRNVLGTTARSLFPEGMCHFRHRRHAIERPYRAQLEAVQSVRHRLFRRHECARCHGCHVDRIPPLPARENGHSGREAGSGAEGPAPGERSPAMRLRSPPYLTSAPGLCRRIRCE